MREILLGFWILISTLSIVDVRAQDSTSYFPLHVGDFWRYKGDETVWSKRIVTDSIPIGASRCFVNQWSPDFAGSPFEPSLDTLGILENGNIELYRDSQTNPLYMFTSSVGDTWAYPAFWSDTLFFITRFEAKPDSFAIHDGPMKGVYRGVIVMYRDIPGLQDVWCYDYLAPGLGLIYREWSLDRRTLYGAVINGKLYGDTTTTDVTITGARVPKTFRLFQNYPNPFNPTTTIQYQLSARSHVDLSVYDVIGRKVRALDSGFKNPGTYEAKFEGGDLPSGIYFYRLVTGAKVLVGKAMLIK